MNKKLNLIIDAILTILFGMLAGGGFLVYYVLLPGQEAKEIYGSFKELTFWGMARHEWASIHLIISFVFIGVVLLHVIFHWTMVINMTKSLIGKFKSLWVIWIVIIITLLIAFFPFFIQPDICERSPKNYGRLWSIEHQLISGDIQPEFQQENIDQKHAKVKKQSKIRIESQVIKKPDHTILEEQIKGSQTLAEACEMLKIDSDELCKKLKVPISEKNERLGRLRRLYNLQMVDIKDMMIDMHLKREKNILSD